MKPLAFCYMLIIALTIACTPSEDDTLPTRVILPTDSIAIAETATEPVIDPLESATEPVIDPLESATEPVIDPLESATEPVIDPLESATEPVIDPLESATEPVIDPLESATEAVIDPLENATEVVIDPLPPVPSNPTPIVIPPMPPAQQTQPPTITPSSGGLIVVMPTFDLTNLPTSVPTPTPYPLVENFATLVESPQIVRITGTVEIFIEPVRDDDIFLLRDRNGVAIELIWDYATIDYIPGRGQVIEAIGVIRNSPYGHSALMMETISIVPITQIDERDV
jgi:hypothetical protein